VVDERRLCLVQVADIVFGWILRAARIQQCPHSVLEFKRVVAFADDVVLMKHVTEKVPVIEFVDDRPRKVVRQGFDPILVIAPQRHVERDDILHFTAVDRAVANRGTGGSKAVQEGIVAFVIRALEEVALRRRKDGLQNLAEKSSPARRGRRSCP
jgi:hypothetical protein